MIHRIAQQQCILILQSWVQFCFSKYNKENFICLLKDFPLLLWISQKHGIKNNTSSNLLNSRFIF